jgi:zinc transport system substrate-binding protein
MHRADSSMCGLPQCIIRRMRTAGEGGRIARQRRGSAAALAAVLIFTAVGSASAAPRVVVTVKPLHSLVAGVMAGVGEPDLIIRGAGSPHTYSLKPSEARLLEGAQVIFWVGESLETFMEKPLAALGQTSRVVEVMRTPGVRLLPGRAGGAWEELDDAGHGHHARSGAAPAGGRAAATLDGHLWLDPANARAIVREAADVLGRIDPGNGGRYAANAAAVVARIEALDGGLKAALAPARDIPFVVFHDAYQYFESSYALRAVGSITVSAERAPGARRVKEIRDAIKSLGARCVFSEPQFPPAILGALIEGTDTRTGELDPLGAGLPAGPDAYFTLMRSLGSSLAECLLRP